MSLLVSAVVSLAPSAKRISEPCRLLRCSLPRFWRGFSAATPTKRLCYRLRSGLCLVFGHSYAAKRISEPWRPLRCSLPRFWSGFSAATPTKRLCYRLRGGLCLVFGHSYAAKRISESCRPLRCSLPRFWNCFSAATPMWTSSGTLRCIVVGASCLHCGAVGLHVHKSRSAARYKNNVRRRGVLRTLGCVSLMLIISGLPLLLLPVLQARAGSRPSCRFLRWICIQLPCSGLLLCSGTISILS